MSSKLKKKKAKTKLDKAPEFLEQDSKSFWQKALFVLDHLLLWCVSIDMAELRKFC